MERKVEQSYTVRERKIVNLQQLLVGKLPERFVHKRRAEEIKQDAHGRSIDRHEHRIHGVLKERTYPFKYDISVLIGIHNMKAIAGCELEVTLLPLAQIFDRQD